MKFVIVPNYVSEAIDRKLHQAFLAHLEPFWPSTSTWRELHRRLLLHFDENGSLPDISVYREPTKGSE